MGMSTDAIALFGWTYEWIDDEVLKQKLHDIFEDRYGEPFEGVTVGKHCCCSEPYFFIAANTERCWRGGVTSLQPLLSADIAEMTQVLKDFCEKHGIEFQEPGFKMVVWADL